VANVAVFANTGANITGALTATGNVTGNYILGNGSQLTGLPATYGNADVALYLPTYTGNLSPNVVAATGNVSGANLTTSGIVVSTGNITGGNLSTTGNAVVGNLSTAGLVVALGNVSGSNLSTAGLVIATGNVSGANLTNITGANVTGTVANATNASAPPTALSFGTDGGLLQRSGTSLVTSLLSAANFGSSLAAIKYATYNLSSAEILNSFSVPITVLAGVAGVTHIPVVTVWETTFNTTAYASSANAIIRAVGAPTQIVTQNGLFTFGVSGLLATINTGFGSFTTNVVKGAALAFSATVTNPTAGDGTIRVHLFYIDLA
jgi:hypothetical protein